MDSPDITKCKSIIKDTEKSNSSTDHIDSDIDKKETELVGLSGLHTDISNIADSLAANSQEDNIIAGTSRTSRSNQNFFPEFLLGHNIESCSNNSEEISDLISDSTSSCSVENRDSIAHSGQSFGESSNNQKGIKRSIESSENSTEQSFLPKKFKFDSGESSRTDCSIEQRTPCDPRRPTPFETLANIISQDNTADSDSLEDVEMADAPPSGQSRQTDNSNTSNAASNETAGGPSNPAAAAATASSPAALLSALHQFEMNPNDRDLNHLQAMLEAHGLPLQMFGGMTSRMHQQSINTATSAQAQAVVQRLEQTMDEGEQLGNVMELCQLLVMGNEETLAGFPTKQAVPILITLLQCEHNFEIMLHACRALHYIVEALPRSSANLVDAIPVLLEKLQIIEYMDVAEQALQVLEILSRKHSKSILKMNGIASCLMFIDFFSISAQRSALAITANCCYSLNMEEFHFVRDSLSLLTGRLNHQDKKSVECVCLCLSRLVENFRSDERVLKEIAAQGLLSGIQQLLILTPPPVGTTTFVIVLHMLVVMCTNCPDLAVILLKLNISETLCYLLIGAKEADTATQGIELLPRSTQELFEIVGLIQELMPALPSDGIFSINSTVMNGDSTYVSDLAEWQWADDKSGWHSYSVTDNHIIEGAHRTGEPDVSLATLGRAYIIDFSMMQQINEDTGTSRAVQRVLKLQQAANSASLHLKSDSRADILVENASLVTTLLNSLFAILYEIYCSSASLPVKHKCLQAILRMVYYGNAELLENVLRSVPVSSHIAAMLASTDSKTVVIALQMAHILMDKLPDVFSVYFRRQGVLHQITHLSQSEAVDLSIKKKDNKTKTPTSSLSKTSLTNTSASTPAATSSSATSAATPTAPPCEKRASTSTSPPDTRSHQMKLSDVLKGKKPQKSPSAKESKEDMTSDSSSASPSASATNLPAGQAKPGTTSVKSRLFGSMITSSEFFSSYAKDSNKTSGTITPKAFLASLNPSRWGRSASSSGPLVAKSSKEGQLGKSPDQSCPRSANSREVIRQWISENAGKFIERYFGTNTQGFNHPSLNILNQLLTATSCIGNIESDEIHLRDIAEILCNNDVSPFEVIHSNFVSRFLSYLTDSTNTELRDTRLRMFLHVFLGCPKAAIINPADDWQLLTPPPMACLVSKLMACFNHLEQFQLRSQEHLGSLRGDIGRDANPVRFFNTHLMKCSLQSHPSCNSSNQWKGGLVRIDPLAPVQSIENFLIQRGQSNQFIILLLAATGAEESDLSEDDDDDEDFEDDSEGESMVEAVAVSSKHAKESKHTFELYIGEHHLPYNMTVYQAVKQYAQPLEGSEPDSAHMHGESSIWMRDHLIWYKLIPGQESTSTEPAGATATTANPKKTKAEKAQHSPSRHRREDRKSGGADLSISLKDTVQLCLQSSLPASVTVKDPSLEVLTLLRLLHSLGRHWNSLYKLSELSHSVQRGLQVTHSHLEFMSNKMAAKASRQLQDPFIVLTGTLPQWLVQLPYVCPFLLPYETRLLLFYVISFDRDRAMQRLQDTNETSSMAENVGRLAHRLERKKKIIQRQSLLEQSETVINDLTGSRAVLEIQYEEEVGSGLGPTLEFYALVSQELQRADLQLWSGEPVLMNHIRDESSMVLYTYSPCGLFPAPIGKNIEASRLDNVLSKFRFLGKFMAKSLMDSRLLDLSLSPVFYKWLLGQESTLCSSDLGRVNPTLAKTISKLEHLVVQKKQIEQDLSALPEKKLAALQSLTLDGCPIEDLCLDFVLPGSADIELKPDGKDIPVTLDNLEEYIWLVTHWILYEGVRKQFAALREGFESFFPISSLNLFYADELDQLFCGKQEEMWDVKYLMEVCHPDHGYSHDSQAVQFFYHILSSYTSEEQRMFAQFVTGSPRLPVGGLKSLNPPLTIVRKTLETKQNSDDFLPSVMTCVNYLKLPDYSSVDIMRDKLALAACEGQLSFHLS